MPEAQLCRKLSYRKTEKAHARYRGIYACVFATELWRRCGSGIALKGSSSSESERGRKFENQLTVNLVAGRKRAENNAVPLGVALCLPESEYPATTSPHTGSHRSIYLLTGKTFSDGRRATSEERLPKDDKMMGCDVICAPRYLSLQFGGTLFAVNCWKSTSLTPKLSIPLLYSQPYTWKNYNYYGMCFLKIGGF